MLDTSLLIAPIKWLIDPQGRTFIAYWLSSLLIALLWLACSKQYQSWQNRIPYLKQLTEKSYWWNASTRQDYSLILLNSLLFAALSISWLVFTITLANSVFRLFASFTEPRMLAEQSSLLLFSAFTLSLILLEDLSRYALHRLLHWRFFWRIHQLHHSATTLTPMSFLRVHPLEKLLYQIRSATVYGCCTGVFFFLVGEHPQAWLILGISGASLIFNTFGANLRHSMIPISYGPLEKIFISPLQHQLHHSEQYARKNYGAIFAFWDLAFSSWTAGNKQAPLPKKEKSLLDQLLLKSLD
jgi:sterol desaturase/sphingolipid hydroxylase (fatty acid hydroxylase superfamily)